MTIDHQQLRRFAPFAVPVLIVGLGWFAFIRPTAAASARAERELDGLRQRIASVRRLMNQPPPPATTADPMKAFERQVASRDASGRVVQDLLRLAEATHVADPSIETGEPGEVARAGGPRVNTTDDVDPRFSLFGAQLTYTPVTMTFDADYASLGEFLWRLRDFATTVELRKLDVLRQSAPAGEIATRESDKVRVTLTLFAYTRVPDVTRVSDASLASPKPLAEAGR